MTRNASPNAIAVVCPSPYTARPEDLRLVRSNAARFALARLVVIVAQGARTPAPNPRQPLVQRRSPAFRRREARQPGTNSALSP